MAIAFSDLLVAAADIALGAACAACRGPGMGLCHGCRGRLGNQPAAVRPSPPPIGFPPCFAAVPYAGMVPGLLTAYKEREALSLAGPLAERLAAAVAGLLVASDAGACALVPMPSRPAAVRRRGLDAIGVLAARAARSLRRAGVRVSVCRSLCHARSVADQAGLDTAERAANMSGALRVRRLGLRPAAPVVVVDDVVTTGASLTEAVRCLRTAGFPVLGAATIAATERIGHRNVYPKRTPRR